MSKALLAAIANLKKEARSMMVGRIKHRRKPPSDGISPEADPDDRLEEEDEGGAPVELGDEEGFNDEYPEDEDEHMDNEELPSVVISSVRSSGSKPIMHQIEKRKRGRPRKV